ncbi:sugar transferase [Spirochaeta isovalerica]|uniref:Lipopolysaccharide/colanic/teichoic acid biosynthesis glycosyltransferase n=1 Tax=Spirochaeta isovalerica TaxID=150 RepID=A0A841R5W5_9SPIO|nr:sugar transferase [Spirochaeta isovalerica]MBB6479245.1 lipopolysaccharide/colanic/teichoic acid biosynthesis glycosyltransferase [Spirochaeta isovalerica]
MGRTLTGIKRINSTFENIFTYEEFRALITYERSRSDRNGSVFSIIVLDTSQKQQKSLKNIVNKITHVARTIDCIGWYEDDNIAILLPDTREEGAIVFGNKLVSELNLIKENIHLEIYSYPDHWLSNMDEKKTAKNRNNNSLKNMMERQFVMKMPFWKRALDISVSILMIILSSPILLFTVLYIKIVSPGPVFFTQSRIGYKGMPFKFYKFRSMHYGNNQGYHGKHAQSFIKDGDVPMEKLDEADPRIIPGGRILRKSCIDEMPQLINVLKGEMSLVGPRPCIPYEAEEYLRWHTHRFDTVPGMTGLWQVSGKNKLTFKQMIRLDIQYCRNMSLRRDIGIIIKTPSAIAFMIIESIKNKLENKRITDFQRHQVQKSSKPII